MTELIEQRLTAIFESVENGLCVQADSQYLIQFIRAQSQKIQELDDDHKDIMQRFYNCASSGVLPDDNLMEKMRETLK